MKNMDILKVFGVGVALGYVLNLNRDEIKAGVNNMFGYFKNKTPESTVDNVDIPLESLFEGADTEDCADFDGDVDYVFVPPLEYETKHAAYKAASDALGLINAMGYVTIADLKALKYEDTNEIDSKIGWTNPDIFEPKQNYETLKWHITTVAPTRIRNLD